jgi:uncharacterized membrane protein YhaH (DUF805 family)
MNLQTFTSFAGRIGRQTFWLSNIVLWVVQWILMAVFGGGMGAMMGNYDMSDPAQAEQAMQAMQAGMAPLIIISLVLLWPSLAIAAKRWHDRGKSAWWILILFVPIVGAIWYLVECGFLRGTEGANQYGPDPLAG